MKKSILKREFVDGKTNTTYSDTNPSHTPEQVRDFYANQYPHLVNARVEGPEILKDKVKFKFVTNIGTKG
jgi:PRTRC genetic system protein C